ncbi:NEL-type E3 ubiquitin ligase domain-containing protein [Pseudomonas sp. DWP3-1-2]|uniref:NEL-type E3 ubiquitin ligase domain-containing protein n=1 Tax=Pseudomonas sp. DWP3-1-2 TaxID=2804645 RepID=UPI003CEDFF27
MSATQALSGTHVTSSTPASTQADAAERDDSQPFGTGHANLEFLKEALPAWYLKAPKQMREALRQSQLKSLGSQRVLEPIRARLQSINAFATPLLEQALLDHFKLRLDVTANQLVTMQVKDLLLVQTRTPVKQTLLEAALQNFEAGEAIDGGFGHGAALLPVDGLQVELVYGSGLIPKLPRFRYRYTGTLDIKPERFAKLSRVLDLGGRYQTHLDSVFKPVTPAGQPPGSAAQEVAAAYMNGERDAFEVLAYTAYMEGHLYDEVHAMLLEMVKPDGNPRWDGSPVRYRQLHMLDTYAFPGSTLYGALVIEPDQPGEDLPCVVYLPGDPETPLKHYSSFTGFTDALRLKLTDTRYQAYFQRFVSLEQSHLFFTKLNERLRPSPASTVGGGQGAAPFNVKAELYLTKRPISKPPFELLHDHLVSKTYADSRVVAVPTSDEDRKSRLKRWQAFESAGMNLLMVAGFFVPVLGAAMTVIVAGELLHEAFVAVEDWTHGETEEAINHLFDIGENIAAMAALSGALHVGRQLVPSTFIESLSPVKLRNGLTRLWKPDLASFRQELTLPQWISADAQGCIKHHGKTWLPLAGKFYRIEFDTTLNKWRVLHPSDADTLSPILEHNGEGAWRHEGENPMGWDELTAFKRLNADYHTFTDETASRLLQITGADEAVLRQVHVDKLPAPALLKDVVHRFAAQQQVDAFITHMSGEPGNLSVPYIGPFLQLLTSMPHWPERVALRLLDEQGAVLQTWNATPGIDSAIQVAYSPGRMTPVLESILAGLTPEEIEGLLGETVQEKQARVVHLARILSEQAEAHQGRLRDEIHGLQSESSDALIKLIQRDYPTLPDVVCKEILGAATQAQETRMISAQRIPLPLAEQAREYQQQLRLNRANEGFFLKETANPDTRKAGFKWLSRLPGWPARIALEVRDSTFSGELLENLGSVDNAEVHGIIVKTKAGYQATDSHGNAMGRTDQPFFTAVLDALPDWVLGDIGLPRASGEQGLRTRLGELAAGQRDAVANLLGLQAVKPGFKWPQRLADGRTGYPMSGRLRGFFKRLRLGSSGYSPELAVKTLYPALDEAEIKAFLDALKARHTGPAQPLKAFLKEQLDALASEYKTLDAALDSWSESAQSFATRFARREASMRVRNAWRHDGRRLHRGAGRMFECELDLSDLAIETLPRLNGNWEHVVRLRLKRLDLTSTDADEFLSHFRNLTSLNLRDNYLASVPRAVVQMPRLERLTLAENPLVLDAISAERLKQCTELRLLDLDLCRVGPDLHRLSRFPRLFRLNVRGTRIVTLPAWLWRCTALRHLDLRHNQIADLTGTELRHLGTPGLLAQLHDNPLSEAALARARVVLTSAARRLMGLEPARVHVPEPAAPVSSWLEGAAASALEARRLRWDDLRAEPGSTAFFQVFDELTVSADYVSDRLALTRRVWQVVDDASEDSELRQELFELAAHPQTCGDGAAIVFSNLEIHVTVFKLTRSTPLTLQPAALFKCVRGLDRLDELEKIAQTLITQRVSTGLAVDEAEVRLAFRAGLAKPLDLPAQPEKMLFSRLADVSQAMLNDAYGRIIGREGTPDFLDALNSREFWMTFLESRYADRFEPVKAQFQNRLEALESEKDAGMTDDQYLERIGVIQRERSEALNTMACNVSREIQVGVVRDDLAVLTRRMMMGAGTSRTSRTD